MRFDLPHPRKTNAARAAIVRAHGQPTALAAEPFSLIVDLAAEPVGLRWWRGVATLGALCALTLSLAPALPFESESAPVPSGTRFQMNPMLTVAPDVKIPAQRPPLPGEIIKPSVIKTADAIRIQGQVTDGLYWSLRDAGVTPETAAEYLHALSTQIDVGDDVAPFDRFDLVMAKEPDGQPGPLLLAAVHRAIGDDIALIKWTAQGRTDWFSSGAAESRSQGLMTPVAGRITSGFGMRYHPILHYARMHDGLDIAAPLGTPIVAAADGQIVAAGWSGGYGREVKIAHSNRISSLYGHMSDIVAQPGQMVRQGQVIGYVGSSGLSTGPHVHFEVRVDGRPVNPYSVQMQTRSSIDPKQMAAFNARLKQLESIGDKKA
jgi:murein DD-endopeptidase MepM/ murein hydrolase activator NlpD